MRRIKKYARKIRAWFWLEDEAMIQRAKMNEILNNQRTFNEQLEQLATHVGQIKLMVQRPSREASNPYFNPASYDWEDVKRMELERMIANPEKEN